MSKSKSKFKKFQRTQIAELRPFVEGEVLSESVSISEADIKNGSPKVGDMIARNPKNHEDQWLVAEDYFKENFSDIPSGDGLTFGEAIEALKAGD